MSGWLRFGIGVSTAEELQYQFLFLMAFLSHYIFKIVIRNWHVYDVASLRDAGSAQIFNHRTALRLYGVIEIKPLRGFLMTTADNHIFKCYFDSTILCRYFFLYKKPK